MCSPHLNLGPKTVHNATSEIEYVTRKNLPVDDKERQIIKELEEKIKGKNPTDPLTDEELVIFDKVFDIVEKYLK
jgi:hypothetical protein